VKKERGHTRDRRGRSELMQGDEKGKKGRQNKERVRGDTANGSIRL